MAWGKQGGAPGGTGALLASMPVCGGAVWAGNAWEGPGESQGRHGHGGLTRPHGVAATVDWPRC